jgi:hypothetical protein
MGSILPEDVPCAKGWVPYCLEVLSRSTRARDYLHGLRKAILETAPDYDGLEQTLDAHLISRVVAGEGALERRQKIREHLKADWFDAASSERYFPEQCVARIYAEGLLKTLEMSLARPAPIPITSWWLPDYPEVKMLTLSDAGSVVLLILTPRPAAASQSKALSLRHVILGDAEAWDGANRVRDLAVDRGAGGAAQVS